MRISDNYNGLWSAVDEENYERIEELFKCGDTPNSIPVIYFLENNKLLELSVKYGLDKIKILNNALIRDKYEIIEWLLEHDTPITINLEHTIKPKDGRINMKTLDIFLKHGVDINSTNEYENTLLDRYMWTYRACTRLEIINDFKQLFKRGARLTQNDVYKSCKMNDTPMFQEYHKYMLTKNWAIIKVVVKVLTLHKNAVISANHPLRKLTRGEFDVY
jgi:hypothetical protein